MAQKKMYAKKVVYVTGVGINMALFAPKEEDAAIHPQRNGLQWITDEFVAWVEDKLNNRPRKRLGYLTPNEKFNLLLTN